MTYKRFIRGCLNLSRDILGGLLYCVLFVVVCVLAFCWGTGEAIASYFQEPDRA